jgi:hypothetical protein
MSGPTRDRSPTLVRTTDRNCLKHGAIAITENPAALRLQAPIVRRLIRRVVRREAERNRPGLRGTRLPGPQCQLKTVSRRRFQRTPQPFFLNIL